MTQTAADLVTLLHQRGTILARLIETPTDSSTLTETVSVSRSTVTRALTAFDEWGLIASDVDQLEPTLLARLVSTVYDEFEADVTAMAAHEAGDTPLWRTDSERIEVLALVTDRLDVLEYLLVPRDKRALIAELLYARSTVDRIIRELEVAGLIQRTADGYTITSVGQQIVVRYRTLLAMLGDLLAARDLLIHLPVDCTLPPSLFVEADIERADTAMPYRLLSGVRDRLETADRIRVILPTLPNPQLLDVCHRQVIRQGATLELVTTSALAETLTSEFLGPLAEMAAAATGSFTASVADALPFGLVLAETNGDLTVTALVYADGRSVDGAIHTKTDAAIEWAEAYYEHIQNQATERTTDWLDSAVPTGSVALSDVADPGRVEREAEGFVQLTPEYFANRAAASPFIAWRAGFNLVDIHAGYTIDREIERNGTRQSLTDDLIQCLSEGTDHAVLGPPGSGKSTVCKTVACRWYEQGRGVVFYRESGTGAIFNSPAILNAQLRTAAADGRVLVVVEDAVRAEASTVFRMMEDFCENPNVTFLVDARTGEWTDPPAFPTDARLDAYRTEIIETVAMPAFDEHECERLIKHFQTTSDYHVDVTASHLLREMNTENTDAQHQHTAADDSTTVLLVLHRLILHTDPLAGDDVRTSTTLVEDIQRTIADLRTASDVALDVGVLVNLLNATGIGVTPSLIYALADDRTDKNSNGDGVNAIHDALLSLKGVMIFERKDVTDKAQYRAVHEVWSSMFLEQLLATDERAANRRFGRCVTTLLALANDSARRTQLSGAVSGNTPAIDRIESAPTEWADTITERIFHLGLTQPGLAPLFGTTPGATLDLPAACSPEMVPRCAAWRGRMYFDGGHLNQAQRELERAIDLVDDTDGNVSDQQIAVKAHSYKDLGAVAWKRGELATAEELLTTARNNYRAIDDQVNETTCDNNLGVVALARGDLDRAAACFEPVLNRHRDLEISQEMQAKALSNLGWTAVLRGDLNQAEVFLDQSITIGCGLNGYFELTYPFVNRGEVARRRGDFDQAEVYYKQGIDIAREAGFPPGTAYGILGLGKNALDRGDFDRAEEYVQRGFDTFREIEDTRGRTRGRLYLGTIARNRDRLDTAEDHLTASLTLARESGHRHIEARILVELGALARSRNDSENARDHFTNGIEIFREIGAIYNAVDGLECLGATCEAIGDHDAALKHYETAVALAQEAEFDVPHAAVTEQHAKLTDAVLDSNEK